MADVLLAAAVTAAQLLIVRASATWHPHAAPPAWVYLVLGAAGAALACWRRYPVAVLAIAFAATFWVNATSTAPAWLILIAAFIAAVLARRRLVAVGSLAAGYLIAVWPPWLIGRPGGVQAVFALWLAVFLLALLSGAELMRLRQQRAEALARSREDEMRRQASEERLQIARDLHDVVAHNISVINVQANTALHLAGRQPERAWEALATIHDVSKQALVELRSVLGVLRQAGEDEPRSPAAGLDRLDDLVERAKAGGLAVTVEQTEDPAALPANVGLAAYRIVQEALTNSAKHAPGSAVRVRISRTGSGLLVQVEDEGARMPHSPPAGPASIPGGNGLAGMRERVSALHGTLSAGPRPGGGFTVTAHLPCPGDGRPGEPDGGRPGETGDGRPGETGDGCQRPGGGRGPERGERVPET
jgi:signal transduction histidine kinase